MIIVKYIDVDSNIIPVIIILGIMILMAIIKGMHKNKGRKEELIGDDTISFQWTSKEEISEALKLPINNNDSDK